MNTATVTKPAIEVEALLELGVELDLSEILAEELETGIASDINSIV
ncbi:MAG: hypothetical protein AAFQ14_01410 [Cyanobacteria bacterium J06621_12]